MLKITKLKLSQFRNIDKMELQPCDTINIIYGDNAQGKTNILEAIWLLTGAKSFRMAKDLDYIQFEKSNAIIEAEFFGSGREQTTKLNYGNKKKVLLNEISLESSAKLAGSFNAVVFSPVHLSLIKEGPALRRRFIDSAICQLMPKYITYLSEYNRILTQRNALLKDVSRHSALLDTLDIWDYNLAKAGGHILPARLRFVSLLAEKSKEIYYGISDNQEELNITYLSSGHILNYPQQPSELREYLFDMLTKTRATDIAIGVTT
ncbi:MAG: DNA replication and repair protein RecF, partial [Oscillospiraceae bacterium]